MIELLEGLYEEGGSGGGGTRTKFGVNIDAILGNVSSSGSLGLPNEHQDVVLDGVKSIASQALMYKFYNTGVSSFSAPDLEEITTASACEGTFYNAFVSTISMPKLNEIDGYRSCYQMFRGCPVETVDINASAIKGSGCCGNMFEHCVRLTTVNFTSLTDVSGATNQFNNMLKDCSNVTVHFPTGMQSVIGNWQDVTDGFGGTNTTVLFDIVLPVTLTISPTPSDATVIINGERRSSITAMPGTSVSWSVSKQGYQSQSGTLVLSQDDTMSVVLLELFTYTIDATPSDATVVINGEEVSEVTLPDGSTVSWSVSKADYIPQSGTHTLVADYVNSVVLQEGYSVTVNALPDTSTILINGE